MSAVELCLCIVCSKEYNVATSRAHYRGYCSAKCETAHEREHRYNPAKHGYRGSEWARWHADYEEKRRTLPRADRYPTGDRNRNVRP